MTWSYINPAASMPDFCCDQDVIYDKGRDRMVWLRQGLPTLTCGVGCTENRDILSVTADGGATFCTYDLRPSAYGLTNAWFDYPRLSLSNNFLYLGTNVFDSLSSAFVTHVLLRLSLSDLAGCAPLAYTVWTFSDGWTPALVETAREIMYMGDQIVTNTGLNDQFRVYWIFDNSTTLNFVDRTIAPYLFTNRGTAHCPGPGGYDPCQRADQRITGAVVQHNTPVPGTLGAAGDKIDFYWNVREGNGFPLPYTESAGFQGNTINYVQRKFIWSNALTFFYAAAGANDREHVALSLLGFYPAATGIHPVHLVALDDDFNGNPPAWETHPIASSSGAWTTDGAGDFLRVRTHSPAGVAWIASGYVRNATQSQYAPMFTVFGRARDLNGMARFDQR